MGRRCHYAPDNLSYVASEDTLCAPTTQTATRNTSTTAGGNITYMRMGRLVIATLTLNVTTIARNTIVGTGLPIPTANAHISVAGANNRVGSMYVDATSGRLILEEALPSAGWYVGTVPYIAFS